MALPPDRDTERRRKRDAALRSLEDSIGDHLAEATRSGELRSAESWGRPMAEAEGWAETPTEFRLPFKILKNAGGAPPELDLFHQRARLREQLAATPPGEAQDSVRQRLADLEQVLALRLEGMRSRGRL